MDIFDEYYRVFNDSPPILTTVTKGNKTYIKLVKKAIKEKKPLTGADLDKAFKKYDLIH